MNATLPRDVELKSLVLWLEKHKDMGLKVNGIRIVLSNGNPKDDVTSPLLGTYGDDFKEH